MDHLQAALAKLAYLETPSHSQQGRPSTARSPRFDHLFEFDGYNSCMYRIGIPTA